MPSRRQRIYHDPLHGAIALQFEDPLEATLIRLIDTPPFQRLRRICQLGPASLTFHGAEASRFTHSLGVMQVARRAFAPIAADWPELAVHRPALLCAALLHDLGHTAFSHTGEEIFHCQHEQWTARLITEDSPIRRVLADYDPALPEQVLAVYRKQYQPLLISRLITSQLPPELAGYSKTVLPQGFAPWFSQLLHKPPSWKMALTVLLALYPTVLLLNLLITPHLQGLGRAGAVLVGNAIGVALMQWGIMPRLTRLLKPWLSADSDRRFSVLGGAAIVSILLLLAHLFQRWFF